MINSKGEWIYTNAEIAYELGISPATVNALGKRLFGNVRVAHWTITEARLIAEYAKSITVEEDAKRLAALHNCIEEIGFCTPGDEKEFAERVKKDVHPIQYE